VAQGVSRGAAWRARWIVPAMIVSAPPAKRTGSGGGRIEIVSANGRRVLVDNDVEVEALLRILRGLETLP
jgi:transposase